MRAPRLDEGAFDAQFVNEAAHPAAAFDEKHDRSHHHGKGERFEDPPLAKQGAETL